MDVVLNLPLSLNIVEGSKLRWSNSLVSVCLENTTTSVSLSYLHEQTLRLAQIDR